MAQRSGSRPRRHPRTLSARATALEALRRVDEGAYANLASAAVLKHSALDDRDRRFVTELVHGTVRMQRAVDWGWQRFAGREPDDEVRRLLRLGTYQLMFADVAAHAAVDETVGLAPARGRGFINAVLRRVADAGVPRFASDWPDDATRLSYPDWIVQRLCIDLGATRGIEALEAMNAAPSVSEREDGYRQDRASQWIADAVDAQHGDRVLDICAAPGGKATALAAHGAHVVAGDIRPHRVALVEQNVRALNMSSNVHPIVLDGTLPPFADGTFDRVLLDAPCSGLGVLHRRPDARWRMNEADVEDLVALQRRLISAAIPLVRASGVFVFSACTLTRAESLAHDEWLAAAHPELMSLERIGEPWESLGRGERLLPQSADTDGMVLFRYRRSL
jgi:16S rRNA (cytosine967-C5)-methyltransferase